MIFAFINRLVSLCFLSPPGGHFLNPGRELISKSGLVWGSVSSLNSILTSPSIILFLSLASSHSSSWSLPPWTSYFKFCIPRSCLLFTYDILTYINFLLLFRVERERFLHKLVYSGWDKHKQAILWKRLACVCVHFSLIIHSPNEGVNPCCRIHHNSINNFPDTSSTTDQRTTPMGFWMCECVGGGFEGETWCSRGARDAPRASPLKLPSSFQLPFLFFIAFIVLGEFLEECGE